MNEDIKDMVSMSGENTGSYKYNVPNVSMHGNTGEYAIFKDGEVVPLETSFTGIVLKVRRKLEGKDSRKNEYYSQEFNKLSDTVKLTVREGESFSSLGEKTVQDWRREHNFLKVRDVIYFIREIGGEVHKMKIKGGSAGNWFEYGDRRKEDKTHLFLVETTFDKEKKTGDEGNEYYAMTFSHKPHGIDVTEIKKRMVEIVDELNKVDVSQSGIPSIDQDLRESYPTEEISLDDIPF